ncbi:MAG: lytic murein transglycosylase B [Gammaproteobacteria bacterium]|nr:lytic murein transglycosylase B [Gammaproteobacteria bacterium]NIN61828.1 lytic murein transglycosylase B [Gammaproteobacteria bacterium]NIO63571.1 lytic murein transglycosylase B [Gammaproteobacteria bacterium]NIP49372.1 lytic murein transglycosylase B [Gammaproteobacteria bacterium]NIQ10596.1 lytic murein transglycosylase B [Gammaproteobacteria bacterium]
MRMYKIISAISLVMLNSACFATAPLDKKAVNEFINYMHTAYEFDSAELKSVFDETVKSQRVLNAISRPAERLPWYEYRKIFIQNERVDGGIDFWQRNRETLARAEETYGVPAHIIVAIIGVETRYGNYTGRDRVMDALSTLAFHYPKRSKFFRGELEQYLLLTREQNLDPLSIKGSYAGAMGMPQFIPSSYRNYAVDFDRDGKADIWNNPVDVIGSVASYFNRHGWQPGKQIAIPASVQGDKYRQLIRDDLKPDVDTAVINDYGINGEFKIKDEPQLKVLSLETGEDTEEIWLCFQNFYVITRYNHSALYAMAVFQLSEMIADEYNNINLTSR